MADISEQLIQKYIEQHLENRLPDYCIAEKEEQQPTGILSLDIDFAPDSGHIHTWSVVQKPDRNFTITITRIATIVLQVTEDAFQQLLLIELQNLQDELLEKASNEHIILNTHDYYEFELLNGTHLCYYGRITKIQTPAARKQLIEGLFTILTGVQLVSYGGVTAPSEKEEW